MANANDRQVAGGHYKQMPIEHWDIVALLNLDYFQAQITKYVMRWRDKNGIDDLEKGLHVYEKYLELERMRKENNGHGGMCLEILDSAFCKLREKVSGTPQEAGGLTDEELQEAIDEDTRGEDIEEQQEIGRALADDEDLARLKERRAADSPMRVPTAAEATDKYARIGPTMPEIGSGSVINCDKSIFCGRIKGHEGDCMLLVPFNGVQAFIPLEQLDHENLKKGLVVKKTGSGEQLDCPPLAECDPDALRDGIVRRLKK